MGIPQSSTGATRFSFATHWPIGLAIVFYVIAGVSYSLNSLGLQYDEAISFSGATSMTLHVDNPYSAGNLHIGKSKYPIMLAPYVGTLKDYILLPVFWVTAPGVEVERLVCVSFGIVGVVGLWLFMYRFAGPMAAGVAALLLATHESYLDFSIFDNGNFAMSALNLGLILMAIQSLAAKRTYPRWLLLGFLCGIGIWCRLNFSWLLASMGIAAAVFCWKTISPRLKEAMWMGVGLVVGVSPFLGYLWFRREQLSAFVQIQSGASPFTGERLRYNFFVFRDVLTADYEMRRVWGDAQLPFALTIVIVCAVALSSLWCLFFTRRKVARTAAAAYLLLLFIYFSTRLPIAEHHLVIFVPLSVAVVSFALAEIADRFRWKIPVLLFVCAAVVPAGVNIRHVSRKMHVSGGSGEWSARMSDLTAILNQLDGDHRVWALDWGFCASLITLSHPRLECHGFVWDAPGAWPGAVQDGVYVTFAKPALHFPAFTKAFLEALQKGGRPFTKIALSERSGAPYADIYFVGPS